MSWDFELTAGPFSSPTDGPVWDGEALLFTQIAPAANAALRCGLTPPRRIDVDRRKRRPRTAQNGGLNTVAPHPRRIGDQRSFALQTRVHLGLEPHRHAENQRKISDLHIEPCPLLQCH